MIFLAIWYVQQQLIFFTVPVKDFLYDSCLGVRISYQTICVIVFLGKNKMC